MRAHGVPSFPEPRVQTSAGSTEVAMVAPGSLAHTPAFRAATRACRSLMPAGPIGESPAQQRTLGVALLSFARCMRAHGIRTFPDPTPQGRITREMLAAANINLALPEVQRGAFDCVSATHGAITAAQVRQAINHSG
jgi:hypothetical protein